MDEGFVRGEEIDDVSAFTGRLERTRTSCGSLAAISNLTYGTVAGDACPRKQTAKSGKLLAGSA